MLYSRFLQDRGEYAYYEDSSSLLVNQDLPIPRLPSMAGVVGVPARESGRPLPGGARLVGYGPRARGLVVAPGAGIGLGGIDSVPTWAKCAVLGAVIAFLWVDG